MKKILFDFISLQDNFINGGMLYTQKILFEILNREIIVYGLYDGKLPINEKINEISKKYMINLLNIRDKKIFRTIDALQIDTLFIGIAQRYNNFDLCNLKCKIIIVCHDLYDKSLGYFGIAESRSLRLFRKKYIVQDKKNIMLFILRKIMYFFVLLRQYTLKKNAEHNYTYFMKLIQQSNVYVITGSEYSRCSIQFFLNEPKNGIKVYYPPICDQSYTAIEKINYFNEIKQKKYFLLVSVDRLAKNAALFISQWGKFCSSVNDEYYCILVGKIRLNMKNCIIIEKVHAKELGFLYKNAFALVYPSFSEGFGYPPLEAAIYNTPSICANVTSIPEICGDMAVYFSPFYPEDLYKAMIEMTKNRDVYVEKTKKRILEIEEKQKTDLEKIINMILD